MGRRSFPFNALRWLRDSPMIVPAGALGHRLQAWSALRAFTPAVGRVGFYGDDVSDKSTIGECPYGLSGLRLSRWACRVALLPCKNDSGLIRKRGCHQVAGGVCCCFGFNVCLPCVPCFALMASGGVGLVLACLPALARSAGFIWGGGVGFW